MKEKRDDPLYPNGCGSVGKGIDASGNRCEHAPFMQAHSLREHDRDQKSDGRNPADTFYDDFWGRHKKSSILLKFSNITTCTSAGKKKNR
jgi:hypothetical protein